MPWGEPLPPIPGDEPQNQPPLPQGQGLMDVMGQQQAFVQQAHDENTKPPFEMTSEMLPDGKLKYNISAGEDLVKQIMGDLKWKSDTMAAMQQEVNRVEKQRSSGNPILDVLATVGGELAASDPRLPPVVSALGRASLRLNPTQQELTDRKIGLMQAMGRMSDQESRTGLGYAALAQKGDIAAKTDEDRDAARQLKQVDLALKDSRLSAKGGVPLTKEESDALFEAYGVTDATAKEKGYIKHVGQAQAAAKAKEADLAGKERIIEKTADETRETNRLKARENYNTIDYRNASGLARAKALADYREAIAQEKPLEIVPARDKKDLVGLRETDRYIDGITEMLDDPKFAQMMGGEKLGRYATRRLTDPDRVKLENYLKHETPRILNLVLRGGQGGASILRTEEGKKMVQSLGVMTDLTVPQAREVISNIKKVTSDGRKSIMDATPRAPWDEYPDLIGDDEAYRPRVVKQSRTGPAAAPAEGPKASAGSVSPKVAEGLKGQPIGSEARRKDGSVIAHVGKDGKVVPGPKP